MGCIATCCCVLHLSGCFNKIRDGGCLWDLFLSQHDLVFIVAELANPDLLTVLLRKPAELVENGLAARANFRVTRRHFSFFGQAVELDLEDVSVKLLAVHVCLCLRHRALLALEFLAHEALLHPALLIACVKLALQIVGVHLLARILIGRVVPHLLDRLHIVRSSSRCQHPK